MSPPGPDPLFAAVQRDARNGRRSGRSADVDGVLSRDSWKRFAAPVAVISQARRQSPGRYRAPSRPGRSPCCGVFRLQSLAASRPAIRRCAPFVGEGAPRATPVRAGVFVVVTERSDRADERSVRSPRFVSSGCGLLFAQQKGRRLRVFEAVCPSRLSRRSLSFNPSLWSRSRDCP
jgi:hypothetical protein